MLVTDLIQFSSAQLSLTPTLCLMFLFFCFSESLPCIHPHQYLLRGPLVIPHLAVLLANEELALSEWNHCLTRRAGLRERNWVALEHTARMGY